jgi:hypothetical protein
MKIYKSDRNSYCTFIITCEKKQLKRILEKLVNIAIKTREIESFNLTDKIVCLNKGNIFKFITLKEYEKLKSSNDVSDSITRKVYVHGWALDQILDHYSDYPKFNIIDEIFEYCEGDK